MRPAELRALLARVRSGTLSPAHAARELQARPLERLSFATVDHERALRSGFPEVVFGQGKTPHQVTTIVSRLARRHPVVLATRLEREARDALAAKFPRAELHDTARCVVVRARPARRGIGRVLVVCAGTADLPVAEEALVTARTLGSRAELVADVGVAGLHRLLAHRRALRGARVLVVVAGLEGALPSVVGGLTDRPVIAVP